MTATGMDIKTAIVANAMQAMNPIRRKLMVRIVLITMAIGLFLSCNSCSDDGIKGVTPPGPVTDVYAWAEWSPDGQQIAVCWGGLPTAHDRGLYLIDTAGWVTSPLFIENSSNFSSMSWSPTGEWLLFAKSAQIYKIKANGDSLTQLTFTSRQWDCDWWDSDSMIVYAISIGDSGGVWTMSPNGSDKRYVVWLGVEPSFVRGDSILFRQNSPGNRDSSNLTVLNPIDSGARVLHAWKKGDPFLYYNGAKVSATDGIVALSIESDIWTINLDGTGLKQLTYDGGRYPNWSPGGDKITYFKPTSEGGSLWIMNADGSGRMPVPGW